MTSIFEITTRFSALNKKGSTDNAAAFHEVASLAHELCSEIIRLEKQGVDREEIISDIVLLRKIHGQSTFISRLQNWPRGYQGDFETVEYLCNGINRTMPGTIEYYLEEVALKGSLTQQHKSKIFWQAQEILNTLYNGRAGNKRILLIGSGPCRELRLIESAVQSDSASFVINDVDEQAISFSKNKLGQIWQQITPITGPVYRKISELAAHAPYDLILCGGLFDYLPDKFASLLLAKLLAMLAQNGRICITNILKPNPWRVWMEYLADWRLIERTEEDIRHLLDPKRWEELELSMLPDSTGLTGLYAISNSLSTSRNRVYDIQEQKLNMLN